MYPKMHASFSYNVAPVRYDRPRRKGHNERWREEPDVIKARLLAFSLVTAACRAGFSGITLGLVGNRHNVSFQRTAYFQP